MIKIELFKLFGTILIEDQEAIQQLKNVDKKGKETKTSLQDIADKGVKIGAAVIAGTGAAVGGLMALANTTADNTDKWDKLSLRTGIAVEELQRWGYAAGQSGADITVLETGMKKLSDTMIDAQNGSKAAQSAYEQLGISMTDLATMTPEQAFERVMYSLADMEDGALKNSIGNDLLGKSFVELKPLIAAGSDGMEALKLRADELGIVLSEDAVSAGVVFGDTLADAKASLSGVKDKIVAELLPRLTDMLNWFLEKMPAIQETAGNVLHFIADTIGFITDNSNILIPVLGGLLGAFVALKIISIINSLMVAYTAFTTTATGVQIGLNAAMMANPIGLVIAAIAAIIAIGIALYMNWDKIKAGAIALWEGIKTVFSGIWSAISEKVSAIWNTVSSIFGKVFDVISSPFVKAKDFIGGVIDKIKGFLSFKWEFPKLKMPHFSVSGSINPLKWLSEGVPRINVEWYAKGGIFDKPTLFNTPYGLKGVGEAGPEAVIPINSMYDNIKSIVANENKNNGGFVLNIEHFENTREQDIEELMEEIAFFMKRKGLA